MNEEDTFEVGVDDKQSETGYFDGLSNPQITQHYLGIRRTFRDLVGRSERISRGSGGIPSTGNRMFWGAVLFTRIVVMAKSIDALLPNAKRGEHWDFSAVASLTRNLLEASLVYHWLCGVGVDEDMRAGRFILLNLHDYGSRRRLFPAQFPVAERDPVHKDLVQKFDANPYLATFDARQRAVALKGEKTPFLQDDVLSEIGSTADEFRTLYRFFSQHTHTGPIAFYRMTDHGRGTGVETRQEKVYMIVAIDAATSTLSRTILDHLDIFPDAETRTPHLTRQQIEMNVEIEQGRLGPQSKGRGK